MALGYATAIWKHHCPSPPRVDDDEERITTLKPYAPGLAFDKLIVPNYPIILFPT